MKQKMLGSIALAGVLSLSIAGTALASDYHSPCTYQFWVYIKPLYIENNLPPIPIYKNFMDKCL